MDCVAGVGLEDMEVRECMRKGVRGRGERLGCGEARRGK